MCSGNRVCGPSPRHEVAEPLKAIPAGWIATNATDSIKPGLEIGDPKSDSYGAFIGAPITQDLGGPTSANTVTVNNAFTGLEGYFRIKGQ